MSPNSKLMALPDYDRPPVGEVALSIQFPPLTGFGNIHAGQIWAQLRSEFPNHEEHPSLPPVFEVFGPKTVVFGPAFEFSTTAPVNRYWFITKNGSELIQVQQDRLIYNWRKQADGDSYPRYEAIRANFSKTLSKVTEFFTTNGLGTIRPNQCEVTYINHITLPDGSDPRACPERILSPWSGKMMGDYLPGLEDLQLQLRFPIKQDGKNVGRLYVQVAPGIRTSDKQPGVQLTLTVRGKPRAETIDEAFSLLDVGRETIVRGFTSITTPEMHKLWGRRDGK
ncbi:MAG: TIGR04255 family protein [Betaproteobacteria bacterium]|nr:TIGR04255 family protein [Betaproteobacteria bacterium]